MFQLIFGKLEITRGKTWIFSLTCKHKPYIFYCRNRSPWCIRIRLIFQNIPKKSFSEVIAGFFNFYSRFSTFIQLDARAHLEGSETNLRTSWPTPVIILSTFSTLSHCFQHKTMFFNFYSWFFNFYSARYQKTPGELEDHAYGRPYQLQWKCYRNFQHRVTIFNLK